MFADKILTRKKTDSCKLKINFYNEFSAIIIVITLLIEILLKIKIVVRQECVSV